ncbi:MmgE/PrpD family protein [Nakamurella leprariae]|uniref:MmgE/PrpD family protein n=1 Tax=Nakamurella leprariae TaxID=2803911 RepID=A0A939C0T5_9ACTN|nr:MmgE/PrpD family protein [Nakamurella leprariae]MBM9466467.1 MmgE/PrpD family protein [Nakamurella leprariae]
MADVDGSAPDAVAVRFGVFAADALAGGIPEDVAASVRRRVVDVLGLCVGALELPTSVAAAEFVSDAGGRPEATAIGLAERVPAAQAAFLNGVLAHSLDFDDTHLPSVLHPSASVVPAALAAAEAAGASGADTVAAIAVGLEVAVRLGMAGYNTDLANSVFFEHGQHATSICGAVGAAASAALLLGLGADGVQHAIGVAASMAAGIIEANRTGGTVKRLHCGWAAHSAVTAAQLVRRGFTGPPTAIEGRFGFLRAFLREEADLAPLLEGLGETWAVPGIFFKPYPANHFLHAAIDAGMDLREQGLRAEDLDHITVRVPSSVIRTIGQPIEIKRAPVTGYQAQFSGPFAVIAGLIGGGGGLGLGLGDFTDELAQDPWRRELMAKVDIEPSEQCDAIYPFQFPAVVDAVDTAGREWHAEVLANRGGPERPLNDEELGIKFDMNVGAMLAPEVAGEIRSAALRMDQLPDVRAILRPLAAIGTGPAPAPIHEGELHAAR